MGVKYKISVLAIIELNSREKGTPSGKVKFCAEALWQDAFPIHRSAQRPPHHITGSDSPFSNPLVHTGS